MLYYINSIGQDLAGVARSIRRYLRPVARLANTSVGLLLLNTGERTAPRLQVERSKVARTHETNQ